MGFDVGFIGAGAMGGALLKGIRHHRPELAVAVYDVRQEAMDQAAGEGAYPVKSIPELVSECGIVFVAVKPQMFPDVLPFVRDGLRERTLVICITPGFDFEYWHQSLGENAAMTRTIPNLPAMVGEGLTLIAFDEAVTADERERITGLFQCVGEVTELPEHLLDAGMCGSSASPAFVAMMIEAMADGIVSLGIPRAQAYVICAQAVRGTAGMLLETGMHPAVLKDRVCSPGGMTIQGVMALEAGGFRSQVIEAMEATYRKSQQIRS
ncbi:MAG: pyrroline-5-carboxylate reductase [Firmicutes bacterium]|nr:pyrroline-5-carboxylate reductase [Bacillota bacterium]